MLRVQILPQGPLVEAPYKNDPLGGSVRPVCQQCHTPALLDGAIPRPVDWLVDARSNAALTAVELFCGIGGFRKACDSLNIRTVWANDFNPASCRVYRDAFGDRELVEGDIRGLLGGIPPHRLLTAGFPCQSFSAAGKKMGVGDPRGTLFREIVSVLGEHTPDFFVLENVRSLLTMGKGRHFAEILSALAGMDYFVEWRVLNATHFGLPQNRSRVVITGALTVGEGDPVAVLAPKEDIISSIERDDGAMGDPSRWKPVSAGGRFWDWGVAVGGKYYSAQPDRFTQATPAPPLSSFLEPSPPESFFMDESTLSRVGESERVDKMVNGVRILYNQKGGARMGYTVFGTDGVSPTLTASGSRHYERYKVGSRFRRLTNKEYARLQGFPEDHAKLAPQAEQYALYGNAFPPPMAQWAIDRRVWSSGFPLRRP